ncbi:MAG: TRAP transporter small permease [Synergistaceae bacterium]|nr:TRAP transporter small permease [Synergistaceae bacterium]
MTTDLTRKKANPFVKFICNLDLIIAALALIILTLITTAGVFKRYVLKDPILWQEEISAFCQVWMVYMGASVAFRTGSHVAIEMLVDALPPKLQKFMGYVIDMIVLFVLVFLLVKSQAYVAQVFGRSGRPTPILRIPYTYLYGVAPYGCGLMIISYFVSKYAPVFTKSIEVPENEVNEE